MKAESRVHLLEKWNGESTPEASLAAHPSAAVSCCAAAVTLCCCCSVVLDGETTAPLLLPMPRCLGFLLHKERAPPPSPPGKKRQDEGRAELKLHC